jgi:exopolyphosphatase/guanosine-5'-triphosphate,3'-diphosphate pyrophosphatase
MLLAAIDIGSNAVRIFFANVYERKNQTIAEKASLIRVPLRLGEDVFSHHKLSEGKVNDLLTTMQAFKLLVEVIRPVGLRACATSAMREAKNNQEVIQLVKKKTGIKIEIIDGVEEAKIVSSVKNIDVLKDYKHSLYIDVGGGSTELSLMSSRGVEQSGSFKIGTVRMLKNKVKPKEWKDMEDWLVFVNKEYSNILCVGVGGNINKIAKLYGREPEKNLPFTNLEYALHHLKKFTLQERINIMGLRPDRADVIVPAAEIFNFLMKTLNQSLLIVPKIGLADGIVNIMYNDIKHIPRK